ncbi:dynein axonemal assembly factor 4-like [Liolophura sinensis]|uniref:dynein axonemal assembly factor 4-like n=1 Tax=Liolophura sinensis TaxID=3198878 RepID=UPI003157F6FF
MPIVVKDFSWEENESHVFITVPLKGVKANKVDIFSSDEYLKVSYPPYIFECLLFAPVDDRKSSASVGNGMVLFKLVKKQAAIWTQLQSNDSSDKVVMREKREEAIRLAQERAAEAVKEAAEKKREADKYAVQEMMKLEQEEKQKIEDLKEAERRKATEELERWKQEQRDEAEKERARLLAEKEENDRLRMEEEKQKNRVNKEKKKVAKSGDIFYETARGVPTRSAGKIEVKFTERVFPTPVRESQTPQEEEWLKKQAEARKVIELEDVDLTEEEKNPLWLRDKGNSFFKSGDYQAAINAFSHAIRLDSKMPALFSNRGACHLKLRNFIKCVEDCSKALELLTPPVPQNAPSRCKAHVRRGTAFCELELYVEGLQDYEAALKICPDSEQLKQDAENIRQIIQSS